MTIVLPSDDFSIGQLEVSIIMEGDRENHSIWWIY